MKIITSAVSFVRVCVGTFNNPYVTFRSLSIQKADTTHLIFIVLLTLGYFTFASLIRTGLQNPFLLTIRFNSLVLGALVGFVAMLALLVIGSKLFGGQLNLPRLIQLWSYTLVPTWVWFSTTSLLYVLLPPPRTMNLTGKVYSSFYVVFSMMVLFWKMILYYLTLRFGLRFDLYRIAAFSLIVVPFVIAYSVVLFRLGIFRIPYL